MVRRGVDRCRNFRRRGLDITNSLRRRRATRFLEDWERRSAAPDEAYLDVSENKTGLPTATQVARTIREQVRTELSLTASAGVALVQKGRFRIL